MPRLTPFVLAAALLLTACDDPAPNGPASAGRPLDRTAPEARPAEPSPTEPADLRRYGRAAPKPKQLGAVRIATYNVENLFDDVDDPALTGNLEDIDDTKPEPQLRALADTIRRLDADVLCLEEIENQTVLLRLRDDYLADMGYDHVLSPDAGDPRGIEQAVLSRFPVVGHEQWIEHPLGGVHPDLYGSEPNWYAGQPITFKRSPLRVDIEIPADVTGGDPYDLTLYVVHFKSGRYNDYWREAEASALAQQIVAQRTNDPAANIAVLGDLNATPDQAPVRTLLTTGFADTLADVPAPDSTTHESGRRIDYVLVNPALGAELVQGSPFVLGTPARHAGSDYRVTPPPPGYASDHYPVAIDILPIDR